jgi:N-acylglucosamine 2-epimerase
MYFPPKVNPETRRNAGHSIVMIMLNVCQYMRRIDENPLYDHIIDDCIFKLCNWFIKPEEKALFETVGLNGERIDSPEGRLINPGHSMETAWFLMEEALYREDRALMKMAIDVTMWSLERGWDEEKGGIFYMLDVENKPVMSLEWDMKLLWPHCEAMIALLYAYKFAHSYIPLPSCSKRKRT